VNFAEEPMSLGIVAVKRNCLLSEVLSFLQGFGAKFGPAELRRSQTGVSERSMGRCIGWIDRNRLFEQFARLAVGFAAASCVIFASTEHVVIRFEAVCWLLERPLAFDVLKLDCKLACNILCNLVPHSEHIIQASVVTVGPEHLSARRIDKLGRDKHAVA